MKKTAEILIAASMLIAFYVWSPLAGSNRQNRSSVVRNSTSGELLLIADGTDPMPGKKR